MQPTQRIPVINVLRGAAILAVIYHHLFGTLTSPAWHVVRINDVPFFPFAPLSNGFEGVTLFFILSGFVLYLPYVSGRRRMETWSDAKAFYRRRFLRLYPLFAIAVIVGMLFVRPDPDVATALINALWMFSGLYVFSSEFFMPPYNWVLWTLGIELWFSLLLPAYVVLARRFGLLRVAVATFASSLLYRCAFTLIDPQNRVIEGIFGRLDDFVAGMLIARWFAAGRARVSYALSSGLVLLYAGLIMNDYLQSRVAPFWLQPFTNDLIIAGFSFIVLWLLQRYGSAPLRAWDARLLQAIGIRSYSVCIWHGILIAPIGATAGIIGLLLYGAVLVVVTELSYRLIERPTMAR